MARLFPDAADNIQLTSQTPTDASTIAMWLRDPAGDGHSLPRLMQWGGRWDIFVQTSDGKLRIQRNFSTTNGVWIATGGITWSGWRHVAVTYDGNPANDPIVYLDGAPIALTETTAPVGTPNNSSGTIAVGNNTTPNRNWGGAVGWFAIYNRVLSQSEVEDVMEFGYITDAALTHALHLSGGGGDFTDLATAATWTDNGTATNSDQAPTTQIVQGGTVAATTTVNDPTVDSAFVISPDTIASQAVVYGPTVTPGDVTIAPETITSQMVVYEPTVSPGDLTILPASLASQATVYAPTVTPGDVTITPATIASQTVVHAPTATSGDVTVTPQSIPSATVVYGPTILNAAPVAPAILRHTSFDEPVFSVRFATPLPQGGRPRLLLPVEDPVELSFSTRAPGGYERASLGMAEDRDGVPTAFVPMPIEVDYNDDFTIYIGSARHWNGMVSTRRRPGGRVQAVEAQGYLPRSGQFRPWVGGAGATSRLTAANLLREMVRSQATHMRVAGAAAFQDSGISHAMGEAHDMNLWRLLEQFSLEGGGASNLPFDAVLYGDRAIEFRERKAPSVADYAVSPNEINIEEDSEQLCTTVIVRFLGSDGKERSTVVRNQRAIDAWNYEIEKVETTNLTTLGAARAYGESYLASRATPIRSVTLSQHWSEPIFTPYGEPRRIYDVKAGKWVMVRGIGMLLIVQSDFRRRDGIGTLTLGSINPRTATYLLAAATRSAKAVADKRDVNTGAKQRAA